MNTQNYRHQIFDEEIKNKNKWTGENTVFWYNIGKTKMSIQKN